MMKYENKPQTQKAIENDKLKAGMEIMTFCEACEEYVEAKVIESTSNVYDFGKVASFKRLDLVCKRCGRYIDDEEIDEINCERQDIIE